MRVTSEFFQSQIDIAGGLAANAPLANQRAMHLRAQAAWQALADKDAAAQIERDKRAVRPL
jgi:hypothetical protein